MLAEFISTQDERWRGFLQQTSHDIYHLPEYLELSARYEGGTAAAFYAENGQDRFLAPLLIRPVPRFNGTSTDLRDATTPYGYPTPLLIADTPAEALETFLELFRTRCQSQGIVTAFFRLHPLLPLPETLATYGEIVYHGDTVSIDLTQSDDEMWSQIRQGHRNNLKRLNKLNFHVELDQEEHFDDFVHLYIQTMLRLSARSFYQFDTVYFESLRALLSKQIHLCTVHTPEGNIACAGLFSTVGDLIQFYLSGTDEEHLRLAPSKLMLDHMRRWGKEQGYRTFHLGGGLGAQNDSLFMFKAGFSRQRHSFHTFRMILDTQKYSELVDKWRENLPDSSGPHDFFPLYRATPN